MAQLNEGCAMQKKYVVRLSAPEQAALAELVKKCSGSSQKVRRAQVLLAEVPLL
jgi:hypothetical protein